MNKPFIAEARSDRNARATHELVKRILKLRWMGMDDEAEKMRLAMQRVEPGVTLLGVPYCTD